MVEFELATATRVSAHQLAPVLRVTDKVEIWASSGMNPLEALLDSMEASDDDMCWVATLNRLPVAMFGVSHLADDIGGIWLLASYGIYTNKLNFMRHCKRQLAVMHERYEWLTNFVDARNLPTLIWLPRLGFKPVQEVADYGFEKVPFIQYVSRRK